MDFAKIVRILDSLEKERVDYAIFGAVALNLHGIVRATEDLDLFVRPEAGNIERLRRALQRVYDDPHIAEISTEDLLGDYPAVRYFPPASEDGDEFYLDILTRLGEKVTYSDLEILEIEVEGVRVRVVSPRTLHWLKRDTIRDKDRVDARYLAEKFDLEEEEGGR
jgi:hypothetical protein